MAQAPLLGEILKRVFLSRASVGNALAVSTQTIDNWCSRRVRIPTHQLQRLADLLKQGGVSPAEVAALVLA